VRECQPIEMDLELNLSRKTSRFNQTRLAWWCVWIKWHISKWRSQTPCAWICESCPVWVKGIWIVEPNPTPFVSEFVTLVRCGGQIHLLRLISRLSLMISILKQRLFQIKSHLFLFWFIHHFFVSMAIQVWCMSFYDTILS